MELTVLNGSNFPIIGVVAVALFRVIVEPESGESLCPVFVNAESRSAAIDMTREHGLVENGDKATALQIVDNSISVELGAIAIGLPCPDRSTSTTSRLYNSSPRARTDLVLLGRTHSGNCRHGTMTLPSQLSFVP